MKLSEYASFDGLGLAALVRAKQVSGAEIIAAAFEACGALNPDLNFLVGETRAQATEALMHLSQDAPLGGVPMLLKDIGAPVAGVPQELGCGLARGLTPTQDSELVRRLRGAGLAFIGRSATPELGGTFTTEPRTTGPTRNPWNIGRSVGGSSGGSAAAVAAGAVAIAHGGDSAGSIRIPAHCCGVFGLKPSRGRNPVGPQSGEVNSGLTVAHVLTRTVRDSAAVLDATCGPDPGCRYIAPPPNGTFLSASQRPPRRLRIAYAATSPLAEDVHPDIVESAHAAAALCEQLGHDVEDACPAFAPEDFLATLETIWCANIHHSVRKLAELTGREAGAGNLETSTLAMARRGAQITAENFLNALDDMNKFSRAFAAFFECYDVLITPTFSQPAPGLGVMNADGAIADLSAYIRELMKLGAFTAQFNMTGQPAMTMPLHLSASGLPIGTQFAGRYGEEETLFSLAGQLEHALPWIERRPATSIFEREYVQPGR